MVLTIPIPRHAFISVRRYVIEPTAYTGLN